MSAFSKEQVGDLVHDFVEPITMPTVRFLWGWTKRMVPLFLILLVLCSLLLSAFSYFREWRDRPIKFLVGPVGTDGPEDAELVEKVIREHESFVGPKYTLIRTPTPSPHYNKKTINNDVEGDVIGFTMEGPPDEQATNLHTLVPLEWCYVHFVHRADRMQRPELRVEQSDDADVLSPPVSFTKWAERARYVISHPKEEDKAFPMPRLYLGERGGGTREIAEMILRYRGIDPEAVDATDIANFDEMILKLKRGEISGAFYIEPLGSERIERFAKLDGDDRCELIDIDIAEHIADVPANSYMEHDDIGPYQYSFRYHDRCVGAINTVAVRRVLVASANMDSGDAAHIAEFVRSALKTNVTDKPEGKSVAPNGETKDLPLSYAMHAGTVHTATQQAAISWFGRNAFWWAPLLLAMAASLASEIRANIVSTLVERDARRAGGGDALLGYDVLEHKIEEILDEMLDAEDVLIRTGATPAPKFFEVWSAQLELLYAQLAKARRACKLSKNDASGLMTGIGKLKDCMVLLRNPPHEFAKMPADSDADAGSAASNTRRRPK
jgi:hypothetical protein